MHQYEVVLVVKEIRAIQVRVEASSEGAAMEEAWERYSSGDGDMIDYHIVDVDVDRVEDVT